MSKPSICLSVLSLILGCRDGQPGTLNSVAWPLGWWDRCPLNTIIYLVAACASEVHLVLVRCSVQKLAVFEPKIVALLLCIILWERVCITIKLHTHSHFLPYLHEWWVDLNKNCSEYTEGTVDSDHVEIRYSLWPMTSLWCHICKRL